MEWISPQIRTLRTQLIWQRDGLVDTGTHRLTDLTTEFIKDVHAERHPKDVLPILEFSLGCRLEHQGAWRGCRAKPTSEVEELKYSAIWRKQTSKNLVNNSSNCALHSTVSCRRDTMADVDLLAMYKHLGMHLTSPAFLRMYTQPIRLFAKPKDSSQHR